MNLQQKKFHIGLKPEKGYLIEFIYNSRNLIFVLNRLSSGIIHDIYNSRNLTFVLNILATRKIFDLQQ